MKFLALFFTLRFGYTELLWFRVVFVGCCGMTLFHPCDVAAGELIDKRLFLEKLVAATRRVEDALKNVRVAGVIENLLNRNEEIKDDARGSDNPTKYARNGDYEKLDFTDPSTANYFHRVVLIQKDHGYVLRKPDQNATFYLEIPELPRNFADAVQSDKKLMVKPIHEFFGLNLVKVLHDPKFVVEQIETENIAGKTCNRVRFHHEESRVNKKGVDTFVVTGSFLVDPDNSYAVQSYKIHRARTTKNKPIYYSDGEGLVEYAFGTALPEIKRTVTKQAISHGQHTRDIFTANLWVYGGVSDREFTLDYYELGDFERPLTQRSFGLTFWAVMLALMALTLGFMLRILNRRSKRFGVTA